LANPKRPQEADRGQGEGSWNCPICMRPQRADEREFNSHIDFCLSRETIKEAVNDVSSFQDKDLSSAIGQPVRPALTRELKSGKATQNDAKRKHDGVHGPSDRKQKRLFFDS